MMAPTPHGHNYARHGWLGGYTGQVEAEFHQFFKAWSKANNISGGVSRISGAQQLQLGTDFVDHIRFHTNNNYIRQFNANVHKGPAGIIRWYASGGGNLRFRVHKVGKSSIARKSGTKIPYIRYVVAPVVFYGTTQAAEQAGFPPDTAKTLGAVDVAAGGLIGDVLLLGQDNAQIMANRTLEDVLHILEYGTPLYFRVTGERSPPP